MSELNYNLQNDSYSFPLGFNEVDMFVDEVIKKVEMKFFFKNNEKDIILSGKYEKHYRKSNNYGFW